MRDIKNGDLPAAATNLAIDEYQGTINCGINKPLTGLTKREAFAMAAMEGLTASDTENNMTYEGIVTGAVLMADALLKELAK